MRILFLADLHLTGRFRPTVLRQLDAIKCCYQPDAVVIAGDLATARMAKEACADVRHVFDVQPMAVCLGNHDLWLDGWQEQQLNIEDLIETYWKPATREHGIVLLDETNADLGDAVISGGYGHFDFGFAVENLRFDRYRVRREDYERGVVPDGTLIWNDMRLLACTRGTAAEAKRQAKAIAKRLDQAIATEKPVLVAVHTVPFSGLNGHGKSPIVRESFLNAYSGNSLVGDAIKDRAEKLDFLVCGHTHLRVDEKNLHGVRCVNLGSHYEQVSGVLYDTTTKGCVWTKPVWEHPSVDQNAEKDRNRLLEETIADGLRIQHRFRPEPLLKLTGKGHYNSESVKEIEEAKRKPRKKEKDP